MLSLFCVWLFMIPNPIRGKKLRFMIFFFLFFALFVLYIQYHILSGHLPLDIRLDLSDDANHLLLALKLEQNNFVSSRFEPESGMRIRCSASVCAHAIPRKIKQNQTNAKQKFK